MDATDDDVELVVDARCELGEGPVWHARSERLLWVDIVGRAIHWYRPADGTTGAWAVEQRTGTIWPRAAGGIVVADELGFAWLEPPEDEGSGVLLERHAIAEVLADDPAVRMNDGAVDPAGRFWAGSMAFDAHPGGGALYRLDPDGSVTTVLDGVTISNGIDWMPDGRTMIHTDTETHRLDAYPFDPATGSLGERWTFATIEPADGLPDGLTIDADGGVWVALWGHGEIRRYTADGRIDRRLWIPASAATKPAFGGLGLDELYITSARSALDEAGRLREPHAGGLFRVRPGVRGRQPTAFDG